MPYFQVYIDQVPENNLFEAFTNQTQAINEFVASITEEKSNYAYAEGKWTLKEMMLHITDTERIFAYRALCVARGDKQSLPGFDENTYAANSNKEKYKNKLHQSLLVGNPQWLKTESR
ncbi:MAG: DinB family protein [Chitinophagaceae bacterium]|nr:DinB family protein [Chitinophagaceae bacterium]